MTWWYILQYCPATCKLWKWLMRNCDVVPSLPGEASNHWYAKILQTTQTTNVKLAQMHLMVFTQLANTSMHVLPMWSDFFSKVSWDAWTELGFRIPLQSTNFAHPDHQVSRITTVHYSIAHQTHAHGRIMWTCMALYIISLTTGFSRGIILVMHCTSTSLQLSMKPSGM